MIKLLDKNTIDKIAAGEVIERPLSIVKELLDNSIDAGATAITVEIKEGGLSFIRVTDNGVGIPKDEVKLAYMRHATSKLEDAKGLEAITTLGFRGEALSTIAAVSQTEMITKTHDSLTGIKYVIHGGEEVEFIEVGVPDGTTIVAKNLFYNTPARKKFLKSSMTEGSYISELVQKIALSHPNISFKLIINNQVKLDTSGNGNPKDTIYQLFGRDITSNIIPVSYCESDIKISGYIGKPFISRGNRGLENYFINGRYIKSPIVNRAIEEGYKTFVMQHKFPFTVLYIELAPEKCDVNVHPTKMEFKYDKERELFEAVTKTVREALNKKEIIPKDEENLTEKRTEDVKNKIPKPAEPFEVNRINNTSPVIPKANKYSSSYKILEALKEGKTDNNIFLAEESNYALNLVKEPEIVYKTNDPKQTTVNPDNEASIKVTPNNLIKDNTVQAVNKQTTGSTIDYRIDDKGVQANLFDDDFLTEKARKKHRIIGQLFRTYWLIEYENNLYIMDQHAAHEKVKYEELLKNFNLNNVMSQVVMPPMIITVSYSERQAILDNFDLFMKLGFDIEEFGGNEFKINAVPSNLYGIQERQLFLEFVASLIDNVGYMSNDVFIKKLSTMACKAAIKGNMQISVNEADALVDQLLSLENPYTCPHGRPTIISISEAELERKFKRQV